MVFLSEKRKGDLLEGRKRRRNLCGWGGSGGETRGTQPEETDLGGRALVVFF